MNGAGGGDGPGQLRLQRLFFCGQPFGGRAGFSELGVRVRERGAGLFQFRPAGTLLFLLQPGLEHFVLLEQRLDAFLRLVEFPRVHRRRLGAQSLPQFGFEHFFLRLQLSQ
jgi:hypothetical protein